MDTVGRLELRALLLQCHRRTNVPTSGAMRSMVHRHHMEPSVPLLPNDRVFSPDTCSTKGRRGHPSPSGTSIGESTNNAMGGRKAEEGSR